MNTNGPFSRDFCRRIGCNQEAGYNGLCIDCFCEWKKYILVEEKPNWILNLPKVGSYTPPQETKIRVANWCLYKGCKTTPKKGKYCEEHENECTQAWCTERDVYPDGKCAAHTTFAHCVYQDCKVRPISSDGYCESHCNECLEANCTNRELSNNFCDTHQQECRVFSCSLPAETTLILCAEHYKVISKNPRAPGLARKCLVVFCENQIRAQELCDGHYKHKREGKEFRPLRPSYPEICTFEGCDRPHYCKFLCEFHYIQKQRGIELRPMLEFPETCQLEGCSKPYNCQDLCKNHYRTWQKIKAKLEQGKSPSWTLNQRMVYLFVTERDPSKSYGNLVQVEQTWQFEPPPVA